jgi:glycosyltransferase involved in cell wall biosynthesis
MSRLHVIALPHVRLGTPTTHLCAYSGKVVKFARMLGDRHEILIYAPESDPVEGATLIPCLTDLERVAIFGPDDPNRLPDWPTNEQSLRFNLNVITALLDNTAPTDIVLLVAGRTQELIARALPKKLIAEPFVGYYGVIGGNVHAAYESYSHMHSVYGRLRVDNVRWFDAPVIHPFFNANEFPEPKEHQGDYLLYLGRLIARKSIRLCGEIAQAARLPLVVAGAGAKEWKDGEFLLAQDGTRIECDVRYAGPVGIEKRASLLAGARATLTPTRYFEPGCNVMFESLASGTPVIASDAGIFPEIIRRGRNGFLVHNLKEAVEAVVKSADLSRNDISQHARVNYSLGATAPKFEAWFERLESLWGKGFYQL